ncbi:MAG: hypothetical protein QF654_07960 [Alphaproteobacteria bacterium]|nr:hypothetical protein [Alphaproteobacteria bacterium]
MSFPEAESPSGHLDSADPRTAETVCFSIVAAAEPGMMPRILELFAKRNLVPTQWHARTTGEAGEELTIDIQIAGMAGDLAGYMARCMRQIYGVECVLTSRKASAP